MFGGASSPDTSYGFTHWPDQGIGYSFTYATSDTSLRLGFGATINQYISDESWGVDNIMISDNATVPLPGAVWLLGSGVVGLAGIRSRRKKK